MKYDAAARYIKTYRAGESGYYAPRKRGTVTVRCDSRIYVYAFGSYPDKRAVKLALSIAFSNDGKLQGRWPEYYIQP